MSAHLEEIPLFPLNTVLFPYGQMQLHIFEPRYRHLVQDCLNLDRPFGIVLIREGEEVGGIADPYLVGTTARILNVHQYSDGRLDILIVGEGRFRIRKMDETKEYLVGYVEPVVEMEPEESPESKMLIQEAKETFQALVRKLLERQEYAVDVMFPTDDPTALSFTIANLLPLDNLEKQKLLETTDTLERVCDLMPVLQSQLIGTHDPTAFTRVKPGDLSAWVSPN